MSCAGKVEALGPLVRVDLLAIGAPWPTAGVLLQDQVGPLTLSSVARHSLRNYPSRDAKRCRSSSVTNGSLCHLSSSRRTW
jgi:hypothetical protein